MTPFETRTELLPHQIDAVSKVLPTRVGALFMDMGTGKSRTAIELAKIRAHKIDRVVWFCPVSLKTTVEYEIRKHTDCSDIYVFDTKTDERSIDMSARWVVIGLESVSQSTRAALATRYIVTENTLCIVDESTYIKGFRALRTQRLIHFCENCRYRLILTGTPMTQGVPDLFAQMYFLSPKILGYNSWYSFAANHLEYHPTKKGFIVRTHNHEFLASKMQPYVYQVTKDECLNLPDKLYHAHYVAMSDEQRRAYERAKNDFEENALSDDDGDITSIAIFHLFTSLQSIACGFWNYNQNWYLRDAPRIMEHETYIHNRIDGLLDVVAGIPANEKIIVWAKYRHCLDEITTTLGAENVAQFSGAQSPKERETELARFRADARFFVATQAAGGHGLTLNEASYVVFYADGFKYSERIQAEDRCHRIGQTKRVTYISIQSDAKIDDRIAQSLVRKSNALRDFRAEIEEVKGKGMKERVKKLLAEL
ncbi:helicase SNF2 [Synergistales bacterium]|nr:helicase SNF2 [Synergistales bacterium]